MGDEDAALDALRGERLVLGKSAFRFEEEFARYCGVKYAISTSSEASTLQLSLLALGIKQGDYVVTAPASFVRPGKPNIKLHLAAFLITP